MASTLQGVVRRAAAVAAILLGQTVLPAAGGVPKHAAPIPAATLALMAAKNTTASAPILMRIYKKEAELEVWKKAGNGRFVRLKTFPICRWSGRLGPKTRQGDRQAPEGFYSVGPKQMNPNSSYYLSFDLGYPNAYDRAHGYTGSHLMVHGTCSSAGCYAMTDKAVGEIYALAREAFEGGQPAFQVQAYPFRMTARNMARHRSDPNIAFWRQLKEGSDRFEATGEEPAVGVSAGRYAFMPLKDPAKEALADARRAEENARIAALIGEGSAAVRTTYADGGQHPAFAALLRKGVSLGDVSRPEALAFAGREIVITPARRKPPVQAAAVKDAPAEAAAPTAVAAAIERPRRDALSAADAAIFDAIPLIDGPSPLAAKALIAGSTRILAMGFAATPYEVAARR